MMRKLAVALTLATTALSTPALARDDSWYVGVEGGGMIVEDIDFDCGDIVQHFSQAMLDFWADDARRTCKQCGEKVQKPEPVKPF